MPYSDGTFTTATQDGPKRTFYPFVNNPTKDTTTKGTVRNYVVLPGSFTPASALSTDPDDATQYLIEETEPQIDGGIARFSRTYCKVPTDQVEPVGAIVSKPEIPGDQTFPKVLGDYLLTQPDTTLPRFDAYYRKTVTSDTGAPSFYPTGGTYTLTFGGNTTGALNYNDSAATISAAFNALTSVTNRGGATLGGSYNSAGGITIAFADYAQITIASGSLTGTGSLTEIEGLTNGGYTQSVGAYFTPTVYTPTLDISLLTDSGTGSIIYSTSAPSAYVREFYIQMTPYGGYGVIDGGTYTITINGNTTSAIVYNASFSDIESALNALGVGSFSVGPGSTGSETALLSNSLQINARITFNNNAPTGGTFTLTVGANTTGSLNYNDSAATVQTALNLLASVTNRGGCTVSGSLVSGFAIAFANSAITANSASLTPAGSLATPSITDGALGKAQKVLYSSPSSMRDLYIAAHGIPEGGALFLKSGLSYYYPVLAYSVPDANTIRIAVSASDSWASIGTITEAGARTKAGYQPGSVRVAGSRTTKFYLPGVTSGITTAADIPIPTSAADSTSLLLAILSGSSSLNVDVGDLQQWRGPILSLSSVAVNAADV